MKRVLKTVKRHDINGNAHGERHGKTLKSCDPIEFVESHVPAFCANKHTKRAPEHEIVHEMVCQFMSPRRIVLSENGKEHLRARVAEKAPSFKTPRRLFTRRTGWIGREECVGWPLSLVRE